MRDRGGAPAVPRNGAAKRPRQRSPLAWNKPVPCPFTVLTCGRRSDGTKPLSPARLRRWSGRSRFRATEPWSSCEAAASRIEVRVYAIPPSSPLPLSPVYTRAGGRLWPRSRIRRERIRSHGVRSKGARQGRRATARSMPSVPRPQPGAGEKYGLVSRAQTVARGQARAGGLDGEAYGFDPASPVPGGGRIPHGRAQPRPASVPAAGRYSQPTHPSYPNPSMSGSSQA